MSSIYAATLIVLSIAFLAALWLARRPDAVADADLSSRPSKPQENGESMDRGHGGGGEPAIGLVDRTILGIVHVYPNGVLREVNQKFCEMLGYDRTALVGKAVTDFVAPEDRGRDSVLRNLLIAGETKTVSGEKRFLRKDGSLLWVRCTMIAERDRRGRLRCIVSTVEDITERKNAELALQQSEEQFRQLAAHIPQVFWIGDIAQRKLLYVSQAAEELFGRSLAEIYASPRMLIRAVHKDDRERLITARRSAAGGSYDGRHGTGLCAGEKRRESHR